MQSADEPGAPGPGYAHIEAINRSYTQRRTPPPMPGFGLIGCWGGGGGRVIMTEIRYNLRCM